jgi:hypothetical protein
MKVEIEKSKWYRREGIKKNNKQTKKMKHKM